MKSTLHRANQTSDRSSCWVQTNCTLTTWRKNRLKEDCWRWTVCWLTFQTGQILTESLLNPEKQIFNLGWITLFSWCLLSFVIIRSSHLPRWPVLTAMKIREIVFHASCEVLLLSPFPGPLCLSQLCVCVCHISYILPSTMLHDLFPVCKRGETRSSWSLRRGGGGCRRLNWTWDWSVQN